MKRGPPSAVLVSVLPAARSAPPSIVRPLVLSVLLLTSALLLPGCSALSYYWQAFNGQMEVGRRARPIEEVMADSASGAELKRKLAYAQRAREFASRELGLPDNQSYRRYADVQRPFVVWNVFSAPPL